MRNGIFASYRELCRQFEQAGIPNAQTDARILCETAYEVTLSRALTQKEPPQGAEEKVKAMADRRISGEPLQYIIGSWDFMGYRFAVGQGVLIPRSETEVLVEKAVERLRRYRFPTVYDLCAGSGCIGLSIKKLLPQARVFLIEKERDALRWLEENRLALGLSHTTVAVRGDITAGYEAFSSLPEPDCVISNPPYVRTAEIGSLQKEVGFEPKTALDGGEDGLDFYRILCDKWYPFIREGGFMSLECGEAQAQDVAAMFPKDAKKQLFSDYCQVERFVTVEKATDHNKTESSI